ncbi:acyl-ACP desaturase [Actinomadura madurae]|uniref:acyl-ACP desaturase n=1 Tax=Actinomadura madurae TaxID=1993 RepID=UPI003FD8BD39
MSVTPEEKFQTGLMLDLEPVVEKELNRHLSMAKEWFPHQYVPWSQGTDFDGPLGGEAWSLEQSKLSLEARESLIVNLLTEDNLPRLPSRHRHRVRPRGRLGHLGQPVDGGGEPARHRPARLPDGDPRGRPDRAGARPHAPHGGGYEADHGDSFLHGTAYVSFQELATRVSHRNTGKASGDPVCEQMMTRIAADENLHMIFYRNLMAAALEASPNETMRAITDVVTTFHMPGTASTGSCASPSSSPTPASTTCACTTTTCSSRCCASGACSTAPT